MKLTQKVLLIRHFKPNFKRYALLGHGDPSLDQTTTHPIKETIHHIANFQFDSATTRIFSSDLKRAIETANCLFPTQNFIKSSLIREINFGELEGKTWAQIEQSDPDFYHDYMSRWQHFPFPNGESLPDLLNRLESFIEYFSIGLESSAAVIAHAGAIRGLVYLLTEANLLEAFSIPIDYGGCVILTPDDSNCLKIKKTH